MQIPAQKYALLSLIFFTLVFGAGCGKKGQIEYQTAQFKVTLAEQTASLKKLQADSAALGNLGYYDIPQAGHLELLRSKVKSLREETQSLTAEKAKAVSDNEQLQQDMDAYRSRYLH